MSLDELQARIEALAAADPVPAGAREAVAALLDALEAGEVRAAEPGQDGAWRVHPWVKRGILLAFRCGVNRAWEAPPFYFRDRDTLPALDPFRSGRDIRIVPGGSTVRRGAHLAGGVVIMPPAFVNVGAHVGAGTMIDSHALIGSCAQIGAGVHVSAAAQIGGVLEPAGAMPVVVLDDAFIGGGSGVYEGSRVGRRAVLAPGVVLTRSVRLYDLVREIEITAGGDGVLAVPDGAVVAAGTRPVAGSWGRERGLGLYAPLIVKYRDDKSDAALALEEALR